MDVRRRSVVAAGLGAAVATTALSGCSEYGEPSAPEDPPQPSVPEGAEGPELAKASAVPVGGGLVVKAQKVVVTQPTDGAFKAFSAVCTHQGCTVSAVKDGTIDCTCHGSKFRVADGSVAGGPAPGPLPPRNIKVDGDTIRLA